MERSPSSSSCINRYTFAEDTAILKFITTNKRFMNAGGVSIWKTAEEQNVCPGRNFHSLKERFKKKIMPQIDFYSLDPITVIQLKKFMKASPKRKKEIRYKFQNAELSTHKKNIPFTIAEDKAIVDFIFDEENYWKIGGNSIWREAVSQSVCPGRSFWSLKERFRKILIYKLKDFGVDRNLAKKLKNHAKSDAEGRQIIMKEIVEEDVANIPDFDEAEEKEETEEDKKTEETEENEEHEENKEHVEPGVAEFLNVVTITETTESPQEERNEERCLDENHKTASLKSSDSESSVLKSKKRKRQAGRGKTRLLKQQEITEKAEEKSQEDCCVNEPEPDVEKHLLKNKKQGKKIGFRKIELLSCAERQSLKSVLSTLGTASRKGHVEMILNAKEIHRAINKKLTELFSESDEEMLEEVCTHWKKYC